MSAEDRVWEIHSIMNDILLEAERGKITWEDALHQMESELLHGKVPVGTLVKLDVTEAQRHELPLSGFKSDCYAVIVQNHIPHNNFEYALQELTRGFPMVRGYCNREHFLIVKL